MSEYTRTSRTTRTTWEPIDHGKEYRDRRTAGTLRMVVVTGALLMLGVGGIFGLIETVVRPTFGEAWGIAAEQSSTSVTESVNRSTKSDNRAIGSVSNNPSYTITEVVDSKHCAERLARKEVGTCKEFDLWID